MGHFAIGVCEHPALAVVEVLVNLKGDPKLFPESYQLLKVSVPDGITPSTLAPDMASDWREDLRSTRAAGDSWLASGSSALLSVSSAPSPESWNVLLNPLHPDARKLTLDWSRWIAYDKRLFRI
ncbi:MAG TPA: RES domain-containing protein [Granulicella sp.]|jgi:RES domain-containing protein|nr:RES domain-containing protein [Granulicella sp.]